jgi:hypothetical protein
MSVADKLATIAENQQKVYEAGKKAEYDAFWDVAWRNRVNFNYAFCGEGWTDKTFKPTENTTKKPNSSASMFYRCEITDLEGLLAARNVVLDTSNSAYIDDIFAQSSVTHVPELSAKKAYSCSGIFNSCTNLVSVRKLICKEDGNQSFYQAFDNCVNLEYIRFEGKIGKDPVLSSCQKLSHDSLMSVLGALMDYSADTSGTSRVCTLGATNLGKLTNEEKAIATEKGWTLA